LIVGLRIGIAKFDLVHTNGANGFGFIIFNKFFRNKTKIICAFHGISWCSLDCYIKKYGFPIGNIISFLRRIAAFMESYSARNCDVVIAVSEGVKRELVAHYIVDEKKITIIHNGVDAETFRPFDKNVSLSKLGLDPQFKYALFVGKYHHRKGLDIAVQSMQLLNEPNLKLLVVGPSPALVQSLHDDNFIISLGRISDEELIHAYNASSFLIHPSRYEGHPVTVLEALACGLPVIASKQSKAEIIRNGSEGFIIDDGEDAKKYIECMKLLLDENVRTQMSQNSTKLAQSMSELTQYDKYKQLYLAINR
jgi:glycosyltransferase involved in cell wall biosynthesis